MSSTWIRRALGALLFVVCGSLGACADGGSGNGDGGSGGMDAGDPADTGPGDAGREDSGPADGGVDAFVPGEGGACSACESAADCQANHYCATLMSGGKACLPTCNPDIPDCPPRFDCVVNFSDSIPDPVCAPVGERCCVDADGDLHGTGVGCLGIDCDDEDMEVHESATEVCDGVDNDCDDTVDDDEAMTLCPRGEHVASATCGGGACEISGCEPGWADCNMDASDGCEVSTGSASDCGACGTPCAPAHATGDCSSGACRIGTCDAGWGDCDGSALNGCETPLNTLANCGGCATACELPRAAETCGTGTCEISSCDTGWDDCDGSASNGCETSLRTNTDCGSCGALCAPSHAVGECSTGACRLSSCDSGYDDCDLTSSNGCETSLRTTSNCGTCGASCSRPNASTSCGTGTCSLTSCNSGFSNCDSDDGDGCEVEHAAVAGTCGSGSVGTYDGDRSCGIICGGNTGWDLFATRQGRTSAWFSATVREDSDCPADIEHRIQLTSPAGTDYDLRVYRPCGTLVESSTGTGSTDEVVIREGESTGSSDTFTYYVEVRHFSGTTCGQWTLRFYGHNC